ncbi:MAG: hypothetical protein EOS53_33315, partial [Mesorhizobium sp.]
MRIGSAAAARCATYAEAGKPIQHKHILKFLLKSARMVRSMLAAVRVSGGVCIDACRPSRVHDVAERRQRCINGKGAIGECALENDLAGALKDGDRVRFA